MRNLSISEEAQQVEECFLRAQGKRRRNKAQLFFIPYFLQCFWICDSIASTLCLYTEWRNVYSDVFMERRYSSLDPKPNHILEIVSVCALLLSCCLMFFIPSISFPCKSITMVCTVLSDDLFCACLRGSIIIHKNCIRVLDTQETKQQSLELTKRQNIFGLTCFHIQTGRLKVISFNYQIRGPIIFQTASLTWSLPFLPD